jgi:uncharacterized YigZ family protein
MAFFRTIFKVGEGLYKERGSKFYGFAIPCSSEDEAKVHLNKLRKEHHLAVHVCYAFRFGSDMKTYRSSDDGEPSNSAGPPILGQIQSFDLTNVLVAVVRYYGGTNLGVGGLINAYRTAAKLAIENVEIIEDEDKQQIRVLFPYERMPQVMQIVKSDNITILEQNFDTNCFLKLSVISSNELAITQLKNLNGVELVEV